MPSQVDMLAEVLVQLSGAEPVRARQDARVVVRAACALKSINVEDHNTPRNLARDTAERMHQKAVKRICKRHNVRPEFTGLPGGAAVRLHFPVPRGAKPQDAPRSVEVAS